MAVQRPRRHIVYFRLTQEELAKFSKLCDTPEGPRSLSELSRSAVQRLIMSHEVGGDGNLREVLRRVDRTLLELTQQLAELSQLFRSHIGDNGNNGTRIFTPARGHDVAKDD